jgi:hypothetical protein
MLTCGFSQARTRRRVMAARGWVTGPLSVLTECPCLDGPLRQDGYHRLATVVATNH